MKSIYILLTRSDTYVSKIIGFFTRDNYTHASVSFDKSLQPLYSFCRRYVNIPIPAGLRTESLTEGFFVKYQDIPCIVYRLDVSDEVYFKARSEVENMMKESKKYRFSILGLILCRLGIPMHRKRKYFCSEFVSEILVRSNALTLPKKPSLMRPEDYTKIPELYCCYKGQLNCVLGKNSEMLNI